MPIDFNLVHRKMCITGMIKKAFNQENLSILLPLTFQYLVL